MKKLAVKLLVIAIMLVMLPYTAFAHSDTVYHIGYSCNTCHSTHISLGNYGYYINLCMSCHRPGNVDKFGRTIKPFKYGDMANPFETDLSNHNLSRTQSSHKWLGPDTVPQAGALPPVSLSMTNPVPNQPGDLLPGMIGTISCTRCHNLAGSYASSINSAPFLRTLNNNDEMCLDCHRQRNVSNVPAHAPSGTHPVYVRYSATTRGEQGRYYYPSPVNSNPANPSSAMKLNAGRILCTTCHGVHYTDSNSRTFDNYTSALFNRLSSSQGYLLRTDYRGNTAVDSNICTNCHKTTDKLDSNGQPVNPDATIKNHNGKTKQQNIQCTDCHGGHVDYVGDNPTDQEKTPNVYMLRRFINITSPTGRYKAVHNGKVLFQNATSYNFYGEYGVCRACHSSLPDNVSQHQNPSDSKVCGTCHTHKMGFSADCTSCHGFPPAANTPGGPNGYAASPVSYASTGVFKDESMTPHTSHAGDTSGYNYDCTQCHNGNSNHASGQDFQQVFYNTSGALAGSQASYTKSAPGTCNNVYCHSNGDGTYKAPTWTGTKGSIIGKPYVSQSDQGECGSCHDAYPATYSHSRHIAGNIGGTGKSYICANCHGYTVNTSGVIYNKAKHVNGTVDFGFAGTVDGTSSGTAIESCTTCHSDGKRGPVVTPNFRDPNTGQCGACHAIGDPSVDQPGKPMADAHTAHVSSGYGPQFRTAPFDPGNPDAYGVTTCTPCHNYTTQLASSHVNGQVDFVAGDPCAVCHPGGTAVWTNAETVTCESCHTTGSSPSHPLSVINGITAPDKSLSAVSGHGQTTGANKACTDCHLKQASQHIGSRLGLTFRLITSLTDVGKPLNNPCIYCHNDPNRVPVAFRNMSTHFTVSGGSQTPGGQNMQCWACHDLHGTSNLSMIKTQIAYTNSTSWTVSFTNTSTGMIDKSSNRGLCQVCHTTTKFWRAGEPETGHPDRNCFGCHTHNARGGAFSPSGGGCNSCHGYPPVPKSAIKGPASSGPYKGTFGTFGNFTDARYEDYSGGGGAHLWHVATTAKASDGWTNCSVCHSAGSNGSTPDHLMRLPVNTHVYNITVKLDPKVQFNGSLLPVYTSARLVNPPDNRTGYCMNVSCHFQPTPRWSPDR